MLWREELLTEAYEHGVRAGVKPRIDTVIDVMAYYMTGQQIARAVCRQLRSRKFAEADAPIIEVAA